MLQLKKLEIKVIVDHVGLSELLKPCLIESVLHQTNKIKPEFHLKIYYHVVHHAEWDVMEVIHHLPGVISNKPVYVLVICTKMKHGADHIHYNHVTITQLENINHVQVMHQPHHVQNNVTQHMENNTVPIFITERVHIQFQE